MSKKIHSPSAFMASIAIMISGAALLLTGFFIEANSAITMTLGINIIMFGAIIHTILKVDSLAAAFVQMTDIFTKAYGRNKDELSSLINSEVKKAITEVADEVSAKEEKAKKRRSSAKKVLDDAMDMMSKGFALGDDDERIATLLALIERKGLDKFKAEAESVLKGAHERLDSETDPKKQTVFRKFIEQLTADIPKAVEAFTSGARVEKEKNVFCLHKDSYAEMKAKIEEATSRGQESISMVDANGKPIKIPTHIAKSIFDDINENHPELSGRATEEEATVH
jgi:hypothetical protein